MPSNKSDFKKRSLSLLVALFLSLQAAGFLIAQESSAGAPASELAGFARTYFRSMESGYDRCERMQRGGLASLGEETIAGPAGGLARYEARVTRSIVVVPVEVAVAFTYTGYRTEDGTLDGRIVNTITDVFRQNGRHEGTVRVTRNNGRQAVIEARLDIERGTAVRGTYTIRFDDGRSFVFSMEDFEALDE